MAIDCRRIWHLCYHEERSNSRHLDDDTYVEVAGELNSHFQATHHDLDSPNPRIDVICQELVLVSVMVCSS
jgi:hypothetical protein